MSPRVPSLPCYLVEWYVPELAAHPVERTAATLQDCAAAMTGDGTPVQLLTMVAVPADDVVFGVFSATSADAVARTCRRAGLPSQRLTAAFDMLTPARTDPRVSTDSAANP